jgi:uncharacterized membrane protein
LRNVVLILTVPSTLLVALIGFRVALGEHYYPYFLDIEDVRAVAWLEAHTDGGDVVLSSYAIGNYLVAHSEARSFLGQQFAVIDPQGKDRAMRLFYSGQASMRDQRALVTSYGITYVYYGRHERALGTLNPGNVPWLVPVYQQDETAIYCVYVDEEKS